MGIFDIFKKSRYKMITVTGAFSEFTVEDLRSNIYKVGPRFTSVSIFKEGRDRGFHYISFQYDKEMRKNFVFAMTGVWTKVTYALDNADAETAFSLMEGFIRGIDPDVSEWRIDNVWRNRPETEVMLRLVRAMTDNAEVLEKLAVCYDDVKAYYKKNKTVLHDDFYIFRYDKEHERAIMESATTLELRPTGILCELEYECGLDAFMEGVSKIAAQKNLPLEREWFRDDSDELFELCLILDEKWAPRGYRIIDMGFGDNICLYICRTDRFKELMRLAKDAGCDFTVAEDMV